MTKESPSFAQNITLSFPGIDSASYMVESANYQESTMDLVEVFDITSNSDYKDYAKGRKDTGNIEVTVYGTPHLEIGQTGSASLGDWSGNVIVTETPTITYSGNDIKKTTCKFKILPSGSRLIQAESTGT